MRQHRKQGRVLDTGLVIVCGLLAAGCSTSSDVEDSSPAAPAAQPADGCETDGQLSYTWHQAYTSPDETPSRSTISVRSGWQPKQTSADSIATYIADEADDSFCDTAPITLTVTCAAGGTPLAKGTHIRNIGGSVDVAWRTYSKSAATC